MIEVLFLISDLIIMMMAMAMVLTDFLVVCCGEIEVLGLFLR